MIESRAGVEPVPVAAPQPGGRTVRSVTLHALAAALMYVSPLTVFVPAAFVSSGLRNGRRGIWGTIALAAVIVIPTFMLRSSPILANVNVFYVLQLVLQIGIPSVAVVAMIRRGAPMGQIIMVAVGIAALGFFSLEILMRRALHYSPYEAIVTSFRVASDRAVDGYRQLGVAEEGLKMMGRFMRATADSFMPFLLITGSILTFVFSMVMLPRLPAGRQTADRYLFRNLSWPQGLLFGFVASGLAPLVRGPARMALLNVLAVVALLYFLQGLAIFRTLLLRMGLRFFGTAIAYSLLGLLTLYGVAPFILFLAGLFDPFFDFRNLQRKGEPDESDPD